jgi:chromosome partitioning protein
MKTLAFYNVKGGVGKTTSCVNIAYLSACEGRRTLLWDLDPQGGATYYLGQNTSQIKNLKKIIRDRKQFESLIRSTPYPNLDLIPADFNLRYLDILLDDDKKSDKRLVKLTKNLQDRYDFMIMDCPPSISALSESIFHAVEWIMMPVIPTTLSLQSMQQVIEHLKGKDSTTAAIVAFFSMVDLRKKMHKEYVNTPPIPGVFLENFIPYRSSIEQMGVHRAPLPHFDPNSREAECYEDLWREFKIEMGRRYSR